MKKINWDDCIFAAGLLFLAFFFAWLFHVCFDFSESYDVLALKNIDEINFQRTLMNMRENFVNGKWDLALANADYGYGNIFWTPLLLIQWPFILMGNIPWANALPRLVSVFAYLLCFCAFFRIARRRGYSRGTAMVALLLISTCNVIFSAATFFHNNTIIPAFILWSIYFLVLPSTTKRRLIACLLFGMALGTKLTAVYLLPVFFLFLNREAVLSWNLLKSRSFWWSNVRAGLIVLAAAIFSFSPSVLLLLVGNPVFYNESLGALHYVLIVSPKLFPPGELHLANTLYENIFIRDYHWLVFVWGMALGWFSIYRNKMRRLDNILFSVAGFLSIFLIFLMAYTSVREPFFMRFYAIPLALTFSFIFLDLPLSRWKASLVLAITVGMNIFLNLTPLTQQLTELQYATKNVDRQNQVVRLERLRSTVPIQKDEIISMDFTLIFPIGGLEAYRNVLYTYTPGEAQTIKAQVYILSNLRKSPTDDTYFNDRDFQKLFEDREMKIVRRR
jgi:hypothetical protein